MPSLLEMMAFISWLSLFFKSASLFVGVITAFTDVPTVQIMESSICIYLHRSEEVTERGEDEERLTVNPIISICLVFHLLVRKNVLGVIFLLLHC